MLAGFFAACAVACALAIVANGPLFPPVFGAASFPLQLSFPFVATKKSSAKTGTVIERTTRQQSAFMLAYAIDPKEAWPRVRGHGTQYWLIKRALVHCTRAPFGCATCWLATTAPAVPVSGPSRRRVLASHADSG